MKIGIDIRVLLDRQYSGVANFAFELIKNFFKIDRHNIYYFFYNSFKKNIEMPFFFQDKNGQYLENKSTDFSSLNNSLVSEISFKVIKTSYPNKFFNYFLQKFFSWPKLDKVVGGTDIFYSPHINFSSFSSDTKSVITIHDLSFLRHKEFFSYRKNFWHKSLGLSKKIQKFDKVIAVSENTKNDLIELLNIPEEKIKVIYSGLPEDILENKTEYAADYLDTRFRINKKFILYLGTIEPRKNISGLIDAYNKLRDDGEDILLILAGAWGWRTKQIRRDWEDSKYKDDIRFIGYVENELKPLLYKKAEIFVYPSFYEGFGFPPLEAMYFGLPVVSSNVSSLPEVLEDCALLINPHKSEELCEAMKLSLHDQVLRERLISSGKLRAEKFNWKETARQYLEVFSDCVAENNKIKDA